MNASVCACVRVRVRARVHVRVLDRWDRRCHASCAPWRAQGSNDAIHTEIGKLKDELQAAQRPPSRSNRALLQDTEQQLRDAEASGRRMEDESARLRGELESSKGVRGQLQQRLLQVQRELRASLAHNQAAAEDEAAGQRLQQAEERVRQLQRSLLEIQGWEASLQQQHRQQAQQGGRGVSGGGADARLLRTRDLLLAKLIGNWQKQTLGRALAAWLRSIEAQRMDRILMDSDKYMSMDSSIDDLLNDALSKRRARSIVASSVGGGSLFGSTIDDDVLQAAAARPVSGGASSYGGSSIGGSLEWMV